MAIPKLPWHHPKIVARFLAKCEPVPGSECIDFTGMTSGGWGRMVAWFFPGCPSGRVWAHRYAWAIMRGDISAIDDPGMDLNHTCGRRSCVNAYHLEPLDHDDHGALSSAVRWHGAEPTGGHALDDLF